jgi:hypothetical protein
MPRRRSWRVWRGLLLLIVLLAHPAVARTQEATVIPAVAEADALLAQWRDEAMAGNSVFGPADGRLPHVEDTVGVAAAGLHLRDFYARAVPQSLLVVGPSVGLRVPVSSRPLRRVPALHLVVRRLDARTRGRSKG